MRLFSLHTVDCSLPKLNVECSIRRTSNLSAPGSIQAALRVSQDVSVWLTYTKADGWPAAFHNQSFATVLELTSLTYLKVAYLVLKLARVDHNLL
jgi:hypothetical protein